MVFRRPWVVFLLVLWSCGLDAFVPRLTGVSMRLYAQASNDNDQDSGRLVPQLPASSSRAPSAPSSSSSIPTALVGSKFEIQYTCGVCETRNCHRVSRIAYRNGVVIARCQGCQSQHLLADHLGWTDYKGGFEGDTNTIEDFFAAENLVHRVSPEVFGLEWTLGVDTSSGSIIGDDGRLAME